MAREKLSSGPLPELSEKLAQAEAKVAAKEQARVQAQEQARVERRELIKEMADMVEGLKSLDERLRRSQELGKGYSKIESREEELISPLEQSIKDEATVIAGIEERVKALAEAGEEVFELNQDLEALKQELPLRQEAIDQLRKNLEELKATNRGFEEEQRRWVGNEAGFAIETVLAQKEYAADPRVEKARELPEEEMQAFKDQIKNEITSRKNERIEKKNKEIEKQNKEADREKIETNKQAATEFRNSFESLEKKTETELSQIESELKDEALRTRVRETKSAIEAKLNGFYWFGLGRAKALQEAESLAAGLKNERQGFYERILNLDDVARINVGTLARVNQAQLRRIEDLSFYTLSKDPGIKQEMAELEKEKKKLEKDIDDFKYTMFTCLWGEKEKGKIGLLREELSQTFGSKSDLDDLVERAHAKNR